MKFNLPKNIYVWIPITLVFLAIPTFLFFQNKEKVKNTENQTNKVVENNPEGTIVVEAGEGVLNKSTNDSFSYMAKSARGLEAYLADEGTTAVYNVSVAKQGKYTFWIKLTDDGVHESGSRSVSIVINNNQTLGYVHTSEDTKGWKWYKLGDYDFKEGNNIISFTKNATSYAAFVMDEFKLVPVQ